MEHRLTQPLWGSVWMFLKMLKIDLSYDIGRQLPGLFSYCKDTCPPLLTVAVFPRDRKWKAQIPVS